MGQHYINPDDCGNEISALLQETHATGIFLVCGKSFLASPLHGLMKKICSDGGIRMTYFGGFSPNPVYEDVQKGVESFRENGCDFILAAGGGSAIDVAKCVKLFATMEPGGDYLGQKPEENGIPLLAVPTTAGSGSEATRFAVVYVHGEKRSVEHASALPRHVLLYPGSLETLGDYQKKATACDALSHAVESYWSVRATAESRKWSEKAIGLVLENAGKYMGNDASSYKDMLLASHYAGRAINITKTTAAHAMSYKLGTLYHIAHGHAVMACLPEVWEYMYGHPEACVDVRGSRHLQKTQEALAHCLRQDTCLEAIGYLKRLRDAWGLALPAGADESRIAQLANAVNTERLGNFPVAFPKERLAEVYRRILRG